MPVHVLSPDRDGVSGSDGHVAVVVMVHLRGGWGGCKVCMRLHPRDYLLTLPLLLAPFPVWCFFASPLGCLRRAAPRIKVTIESCPWVCPR